ncbi:MAG: hypothetical protein GXP24_11090 [Planctomycetes bacterium]|nr:hypothetical protein [Planctomycetota bacterium]
MSPSRFCTLLCLSSLLVLSHFDVTEAQIVRRFAGGGVQVNAPFVRVNVGPGGATSVRAPFVAVDSPGRTFLGRRWRLMAQPRHTAPSNDAANTGAARSAQNNPAQKAPDIADVDALPYPTASELAAMEDTVLVETLRQMTARLHFRLSLLNTGESWQKYLVLSRDLLGSPGASPAAAQFDAVRRVLPRYQKVQNDPQFAKISALPSFVATFAALQETDRRFGRSANSPVLTGPEITDPNSSRPAPANVSTERATEGAIEIPTEKPQEVLPTPQPAVVPNATRGERSILKRK